MCITLCRDKHIVFLQIYINYLIKYFYSTGHSGFRSFHRMSFARLGWEAGDGSDNKKVLNRVRYEDKTGSNELSKAK